MCFFAKMSDKNISRVIQKSLEILRSKLTRRHQHINIQCNAHSYRFYVVIGYKILSGAFKLYKKCGACK